jgi:hypothetical protein
MCGLAGITIFHLKTPDFSKQGFSAKNCLPEDVKFRSFFVILLVINHFFMHNLGAGNFVV